METEPPSAVPLSKKKETLRKRLFHLSKIGADLTA